LKIRTHTLAKKIKKTHLLESELKNGCIFGHKTTLTNYLILFTSNVLYLNINSVYHFPARLLHALLYNVLF